MASKKTARDSAHTEKAKSTEPEKTTGTSRKITDLSLGDIVLIPGFDGPRTICNATKVGDGADAGKFEVALRDETGEVEHARFGPEEEVQMVGKAARGGKASPVPAESAARRTSAKGKGTKNKAPKPEGAKQAKKAPNPPKEKKTSALDAAAKVLGETGEPMNCQDMIKSMSDKGYWKSPGGLTPHATLYSALLREIKAKGKEARFKKADRGKFSLT
ncbi:MAG TPA: HTH domain-containing protein [Gemmataceae bacterium]|nr:HTH domain-containing protein [Gemmataceae bacterium]